MVASSTGSKVIATATVVRGMKKAARPMPRKKATGSATSASRLMATVVPEKTTARPAEAMAAETAASLARLGRAVLPPAGDDQQ
jgi:hypothetical protein